MKRQEMVKLLNDNNWVSTDSFDGSYELFKNDSDTKEIYLGNMYIEKTSIPHALDFPYVDDIEIVLDFINDN
jgi:hypothetical protein